MVVAVRQESPRLSSLVLHCHHGIVENSQPGLIRLQLGVRSPGVVLAGLGLGRLDVHHFVEVSQVGCPVRIVCHGRLSSEGRHRMWLVTLHDRITGLDVTARRLRGAVGFPGGSSERGRRPGGRSDGEFAGRRGQAGAVPVEFWKLAVMIDADTGGPPRHRPTVEPRRHHQGTAGEAVTYRSGRGVRPRRATHLPDLDPLSMAPVLRHWWKS